MSAAVSAVRVQSSDCPVYECPECSAYHFTLHSGKHLLWFVVCERCDGHYECESCGHLFLKRHDGWYRLFPNDSVLKVSA
jgi:hypothetical protein